MKYITVIIFIVLLAASAFAGDVRVKGHYRDTDGDGYKETYVNPYYRTAPDSNVYNNYSTQGNTNPYTGERGYVNPYENTHRNNSNQHNSIYDR